MKSALALILLLMSPVSAIAEGRESNGGSDVAIEFQIVAEQLLQELDHIGFAKQNFPGIDLLKLLASTDIITTDLPLLVKVPGTNELQESTAMNELDPLRISIHRARWNAMKSLGAKKALVLHELLGLAGLEGTGNYTFTKMYLKLRDAYCVEDKCVGPFLIIPRPLPGLEAYDYSCTGSASMRENASGKLFSTTFNTSGTRYRWAHSNTRYAVELTDSVFRRTTENILPSKLRNVLNIEQLDTVMAAGTDSSELKLTKEKRTLRQVWSSTEDFRQTEEQDGFDSSGIALVNIQNLADGQKLTTKIESGGRKDGIDTIQSVSWTCTDSKLSYEESKRRLPPPLQPWFETLEKAQGKLQAALSRFENCYFRRGPKCALIKPEANLRLARRQLAEIWNADLPAFK